MEIKQLTNIYKSSFDIPFNLYAKYIKDLEKEDNTTIDIMTAVADFLKVEPVHIINLSFEDFENLMKYLQTIISEKVDLITRFYHNNIEYGLIPNFEKISTGELIDLDTYYLEKRMDLVLSILYRPITKKRFNPFNIFKQERYTIKEYEGIDEDFKTIPLAYVTSVANFFFK